MNNDNYRDSLEKAWESSVSEFDKAVIVISSGAFAIAYAFTDKIVTYEDACCKAILFLSLLCSVIPVLLGLFNYFREINANDRAIQFYDRKDMEGFKTWLAKANKISKCIRLSQLVCLVFSCCFFAIYILINVK